MTRGFDDDEPEAWRAQRKRRDARILEHVAEFPYQPPEPRELQPPPRRLPPDRVCVHCRSPFGGSDGRLATVYVYPRSRCRAHLACVSQASAAATDDLLWARRSGA